MVAQLLKAKLGILKMAHLVNFNGCQPSFRNTKATTFDLPNLFGQGAQGGVQVSRKRKQRHW
jgi:hypothetical protein